MIIRARSTKQTKIQQDKKREEMLRRNLVPGSLAKNEQNLKTVTNGLSKKWITSQWTIYWKKLIKIDIYGNENLNGLLNFDLHKNWILLRYLFNVCDFITRIFQASFFTDRCRKNRRLNVSPREKLSSAGVMT